MSISIILGFVGILFAVVSLFEGPLPWVPIAMLFVVLALNWE